MRDWIVADFRDRKNLELYFLIPIAAVAVVGGAAGWVKPEFVLSVTLALLGVLGISLLKINHNVDTLEKSHLNSRILKALLHSCFANKTTSKRLSEVFARHGTYGCGAQR
jgi:hypothetical protein